MEIISNRNVETQEQLLSFLQEEGFRGTQGLRLPLSGCAGKGGVGRKEQTLMEAHCGLPFWADWGGLGHLHSSS